MVNSLPQAVRATTEAKGPSIIEQLHGTANALHGSVDALEQTLKPFITAKVEPRENGQCQVGPGPHDIKSPTAETLTDLLFVLRGLGSKIQSLESRVGSL
jgi:hypothetical protein